jgi:hypothetical protein
MQAISYQLKYCERCGALRLRPAASAETYCPSCEQALLRAVTPTALPCKRPPKRQVPKAGPPVSPGPAQIPLLSGRLP